MNVVLPAIVRLDPAFDALVPPDARIEKLAGGFTFTEEQVAHGSNTLLTDAGVFPSKSEGRRLVAGGALTINGVRITDPDEVPELVAGEWLDVKIGKRRREIGRLER